MIQKSPEDGLSFSASMQPTLRALVCEFMPSNPFYSLELAWPQFAAFGMRRALGYDENSGLNIVTPEIPLALGIASPLPQRDPRLRSRMQALGTSSSETTNPWAMSSMPKAVSSAAPSSVRANSPRPPTSPMHSQSSSHPSSSPNPPTSTLPYSSPSSAAYARSLHRPSHRPPSQ